MGAAISLGEQAITGAQSNTAGGAIIGAVTSVGESIAGEIVGHNRSVNGSAMGARPSGLTLAEQNQQGGFRPWSAGNNVGSLFNSSEHSGVGAVPPSQIMALSNPATKMAIAQTRGFARTQLQSVGQQFNSQQGAQVLGTSS